MLRNSIITLLISFISGVLAVTLLSRLVTKLRVLIHRQIPLVGGTAIWIAFFTACAYNFHVHKITSWNIAGILIASFVMLIFGIIDDWKELSVGAKLLFQVVATIVLIVFGVRTQIVYIGTPLNVLVTLLWVIGITNAFNHIDIMDGLAGGAALIVGIAFFAVAFLGGDYQMMTIALAICGSIAGFLVFNLAPAKIYMGNAGSHFLGFILSAVALLVHYAPVERPIALLSPLLILGFLIFDTTFLVAMRIKKKKLPFKKSNDHLAMRLRALGYSARKTLLLLLGLCAAYASCGVVVSQASTRGAAFVITAVAVMSIWLMIRMSKIEVHG